MFIVDDDATASTLMARMLEREGFRQVTTFGDGHRALASMRNQHSEVVVLDVHMPGIDGFEVLRSMLTRQETFGDITAVLAISGDASPNTCQAMLSMGADDFLARPFHGNEFVSRVRRLARLNREIRHAIRYAQWLQPASDHLPRDTRGI